MRIKLWKLQLEWATASKEPEPEVGPNTVLNWNRHFLAVGCTFAGKTTMLGVGLRRLHCLGIYTKFKPPPRKLADELKGTSWYPHYRCTASSYRMKGGAEYAKLPTAGHKSLLLDVWHDCEGSKLSGEGEGPSVAKPLIKAAKKVHRLFYVTPVNVVLTDEGRLNRQWVADVKDFGDSVRRSSWLQRLLTMRTQKLVLVISKSEEERSPGLSSERLRNLLALLREEVDLAENYEAAFLTRAINEPMREKAFDDKSWDARVREWTQSGEFLRHLGAVGFAQDASRLSDEAVGDRVAVFESAVPLAWAAGLLKEAELERFPQAFTRLHGVKP